MEHKFEKSVPYHFLTGCPKGYRKRSEYTTAAGTYVPARCVRSTSPYAESGKHLGERLKKRMTARIHHSKNTNKSIKCPRGYIGRAAYVRRYSTSVRSKGYTVRKASGTTYKVHPRNRSLYVPASCIKDTGKPGKGVPNGQAIAPLRKGELTKYGYSTNLPENDRRKILLEAVKDLGALTIYRKLDAVAKLSLRISPENSRIFAKDRDWIRKTFGPLKAF
jgi:hypothetical protein